MITARAMDIVSLVSKGWGVLDAIDFVREQTTLSDSSFDKVIEIATKELL